MTLRLIALMSVTLFCCLAAFGLLLSRSEDAIMEEVERTVSEAGKQTVAAFARREFRFVSSGDLGFGMSMGWDGEEPPDLPEGVARRVFRSAAAGLDTCDCPIHRAVRAPAEMFVVTVDAALEPPGSEGLRPEGRGAPDLDRLLERVRERHGGELPPNALFIRASNVFTEVGDDEIRARIPMFRFAGERDGATTYEIDRHEVRLREGEGVVLDVETATGREATEDVVLSLPTRDYATLFDKIRERMLFLFLGVFALGTVLSAGLARRFTRPIRELDEGLRRVSEGDLETRVTVAGGDEVGRLGLGFNDMTRRLRVGRERARELTRQEKLSALGRLAAGVAHDVRNPLHSINLSLQHLRETSAPEDAGRAAEFERTLDVIRREIHRLDGMVANFLRFARSERRERRPVDLGDLLSETAQLVRKEAEHRDVRVAVEAAAGVATIEADVEALRSALLNLVLNALEAMEDGGRVTLRTGRAADAVVVEVVDDGPGIEEAEQERVFEFGYTTRDGGHGLGLAMVHQIVVEEHGGRVELESAPGEGATFRLELPLAGGAP
ncbi:MAG: ATP-binding protein [Planctomycetota bacterium JB042]